MNHSKQPTSRNEVQGEELQPCLSTDTKTYKPTTINLNTERPQHKTFLDKVRRLFNKIIDFIHAITWSQLFHSIEHCYKYNIL